MVAGIKSAGFEGRGELGLALGGGVRGVVDFFFSPPPLVESIS